MSTGAEEREGEARWQTASLREIVLGAQDNLTNVLATVLGVAIGSGNVKTVALAGLATGLAEAISMGGVLYTSTAAEQDLARQAARGDEPVPIRLTPTRAAFVTLLAALGGAAIPLSPFALLPLRPAMAASVAFSVVSLFALGGWKGRMTRRSLWRDGAQFVLIGTFAALAAALVGAFLKVNGA